MCFHIASAHGSRGSKCQTEVRKWSYSNRLLARPKRFELLTPRFVVWCSIQLSYGRVFRQALGQRPRCIRSKFGRPRKSALATRSGPAWQGAESRFCQSKGGGFSWSRSGARVGANPESPCNRIEIPGACFASPRNDARERFTPAPARCGRSAAPPGGRGSRSGRWRRWCPRPD